MTPPDAESGDWNVRFFKDPATGRVPVREWLDSLQPHTRAAVVAGIEVVLSRLGPGVCSTEYGKALGKGLYEFRLRHDETVIRRKHDPTADKQATKTGKQILVRLFFHVYGDRVVLLLHGYDKQKSPSSRAQGRAIGEARKRLRHLQLERRRREKGQSR